ncbi:MAG: hypothetical protein BGO39_02150 [Chloroflexi bacterium 54-19]|nr:MAG: hypothetical protein BGO39_02150 [Chloroflexi bacterium 54-19]
MLIYDDYFPNVLSAFRVAEFNYYLANLNCDIVSAQPNFDTLKEEYLSFYPQNRDRLKRFVAETALNYRLLYVVFLKNAFKLLPIIEREEIPFIFTLYPGGEFLFYDIISDSRVLRLTNSKFFKRMIVTQKITYNYLLRNGLCPPEKIEYIYGAVIPAELYNRFSIPHRYYGQDKATFDICFVAMKYMAEGRDKGYDVFLEVAKVLARLSPLFRFHVVGGFGAQDIDVTSLADRITFYGHQPTSFFPEFYAGMDITLSPNIPFVLMPGTFDGFPTGACSEAALCGVAVFCTDLLNENEEFTPGEDICIIPGEVEGIVGKIIPYFNEPSALHRLAKAGQRRFREIYGTQRQLVPRLKLFKKYLG